jgi:hypothetical protein
MKSKYLKLLEKELNIVSVPILVPVEKKKMTFLTTSHYDLL